MKKLFLLLVAVLSIGLCASAQTRTVTGIVLDANTDEPLIGASVTAGTSNQGVATDIDGAFSIPVPANVTKLTVSYVGYESQTVNITSTNLVIKLHPQANVLDDVIAVAYGTAKKSEYTGSAGVVKADQLENALVADVTSALSGKVAGVQTFSANGQPGTAPSVRIRGTGSINAGSDPLYVVDGVPYMGEISNISTQDIEAMTVLKDAASTALYGARGANGVILITTKRGSEGKARVTVDARWGTNSRAIPNYDVITDPRQYLEMTYETMANTQQYYFGVKDMAQINSYVNKEIWNYFGGYQTYTIPEGQLVFDQNGRFNPNATEGYSNGKYYWKPDNWSDGTFIHGLRQEYNVSISGGTQRLQYYLSASYLEDEGIIKGSHFNRFTTLAKVDYQAKDWLKIGSSIQYAYSNTASPRDQTEATSNGNAFAFANTMAPVYPMYVRNADGSIMYNQQYGNPVYDYGDGKDYGNGMMGAGRTPQGNPVSGLLYDVNDFLIDVLDAKWYAQLTPIKGLSITENVGYFLDNTRQHILLNPVYGQFVETGGQAIQGQTRMRDITLQTLVNYDFTIADRHNIGLMAGYESEDFAIEAVSAQGTNLYQPLVPYVNNTIDNLLGSGSYSELAHRGFLFRAKYNFEDRYFFMGSVRRDGSSRFAPGHRWGTFWSLSIGWDIAKERFMEEFTNVDLLKFRASFGQNGNDAIGSALFYMPWADMYTMNGANGVFSDGVLAQKGNADLTWETSNAFNIGFDFSFFKGMISGSLEYYNRQTSDMLFNLPVAPSLGYNSIPSNVGSMRNNGFEIDLNYRPVNTRDITWDIFANLTYCANKILKLDPSILNEDGEWLRSTTSHLREGESIYDLYLPQWAGVNPETGFAEYWAKRDIAWDEDGNVTATEEYKTTDYLTAQATNSKHTGNIAPKVYGGFGTTVNAYGFDLSVSFAYQAGGKLIDSGYQNYMSVQSVGAMHVDLLNAWKKPGDITDVPMLISQAERLYPISVSDHLLISSNYLSLNNITLGYNLPSKWTKKIGIDGVRIYGAAENVALWSRRKGLDPRQSYLSSENSTYSPIRAITGGIRVNF